MVSATYHRSYFETLSYIKRWAQDECADRGAPFDASGWTEFVHPAQFVPQQANGIDCGVFMLAAARCILGGHEFDFSQKDIPFLRKKMTLDLYALG
jgi:Ulp1 family protease